LIDNAAQYAPSQSTITVNMENDSNNLKITVHDTGGSIPPEECSLIFQRFYRVQKARDRHSGGAGLGLAIAREIAVLHGGDITVRSNLLEGTLFTIVLPLAKE
jgi:two-component system sensor histidine kinase RstB